MKVAWKQGRYTLMGEVLAIRPKGYVVIVTSYDLRQAAKYMDRWYFVRKEVAQVV